MAFKQFHIDSADDRPADQRRARAYIGGSLDQRRAKGTPSQLAGQFIADPVFRPADLAMLQQWCAPDAERPLAVEIGFQMGEFAAEYCLQRPHVRYLGFEVRKHFCTETDRLLVERGVPNARLALVDARLVLADIVRPASLQELFVFFPDPWWKPRHVKKRLISKEFVEDAAHLLAPGGRLLLKTDVQAYADFGEETMRGHAGFAVERLADPAADLPPTLRERRCRLHGYPTWAVQAVRLADP